ncbi:hypothetical protein C2S51_021526 [Perilla frutescens var. frutescens]|nr:hypothetical protein C2S51_021526 [Perilla frutescens var. frutescens]
MPRFSALLCKSVLRLYCIFPTLENEPRNSMDEVSHGVIAIAAASLSLHRSEGNIFSITVTKDYIFTGSSSCRIHAWKQSDCTETICLKASMGQVRVILACGKLLITTHGDCRIRLWDDFPAEEVSVFVFEAYPHNRMHRFCW